MNENKLSNSQTLVLETLKNENALGYEEIAEITGLSYDGVRGRVSELKKMGYEIGKIKDGKNTFVSYKENKTKLINNKEHSYRRPLEMKDALIRKSNAVEDFYGITDFLDKIKKNKCKKEKKLKLSAPSEDNKYGVFLLSDLHFGEIIYDYNTGDKVVYNSEIAKTRVKILTQSILEKLKKYKINHLIITGIGDIVDGDSIYRNHLFGVDKSAIAQTKDATEALSNMLRTFANKGITVEMYNVRGNHGITNYKNLEEDNWDNVVYDMLSIIFESNENVSIFNFKGNEGKISVGNKNIVLYHGEKMSSQIKTSSGLREFRGICGKHKLSDGDMVVIGHLHEFGIETDQGKILIRNGSISDTSEYAYRLNLYSEPMQVLMILDETSNYPTILPVNVK